MRLGTCVPSDETVHINGQFSLEKALSALSSTGIRGCMYSFVSDESRWEATSRELSVSLKNTGVTLMEYIASLYLQPLDRSSCLPLAHKFVRLLSIAESIGCLNVVACTGGFGKQLDPHPRNRSQESWDLLRETCLLIAEEAEQKRVRARLMIEPVYTSLIWSPNLLAQFVDEVGSPSVQGHMDIVNCLTFDNVYDHADFTRESFRVLGSRIHSAHLKDVAPIESYLPGLEERYIGEGVMDIRCYLSCLSQMPPGFPVLIEHIRDHEIILRSYRRISSIAEEMGISVWHD